MEDDGSQQEREGERCCCGLRHYSFLPRPAKDGGAGPSLPLETPALADFVLSVLCCFSSTILQLSLPPGPFLIIQVLASVNTSKVQLNRVSMRASCGLESVELALLIMVATVQRSGIRLIYRAAWCTNHDPPFYMH